MTMAAHETRMDPASSGVVKNKALRTLTASPVSTPIALPDVSYIDIYFLAKKVA